MKKWKKSIAAVLMTLTMSAMATPQAMAASAPPADTNAAMIQLRMADTGADFSKGILVDEFWGFEDDGTPYVERTYISVKNSISRSPMTKEFTKTKDYGATGSVEVTGEFEYDSSAKTVYVLSSSGEFHESGGVSEYEDLGTSTSGEGSTKATVKYRCRVNKNLGGWSTYSVSVSCNYSGNPS